MREVGVIHRGGDDIKIHQDPQVTTAGASILWQFYSTERGINFAKIVFEDSNSKFFYAREGSDMTHEKVVRLNKGHGRTVGTAPHLDLKSLAAVSKKYTVYFYRNNPKNGEEEVAKLDPEIIICNP